MTKTRHTFSAEVEWLGPDGAAGPRRHFSRAHLVRARGVPDIPGSAAKIFHGDADRWNPEQMLLAAVSQCYLMTFLFLAHRAGAGILTLEVRAEGAIMMDTDGIGGEFSHITVFPTVTVRQEPGIDTSVIDSLHAQVEMHCFIARSLATPIRVEAATTFA